MTRRLRRGAAVLALALVPGLAACGQDGFDPATNMVTADNAAGQTPKADVLARAIVIVKSADAAVAALSGTLINNADAPDTLQRIDITPDQGAAIALTPNLTLTPGQALNMGTESAPPITVPNATDLKVGHFAVVRLRFLTNGEIKLNVPVVVRQGFYENVRPATGGTTTQAEPKRAAECVVVAGNKSRPCKTPAEFAKFRAAARAAGNAGKTATSGATTGATTGATATKGMSAAATTAGKAATRTTTRPVVTAKTEATPRTAAKVAPKTAHPAGHEGMDMSGMDMSSTDMAGHKPMAH